MSATSWMKTWFFSAEISELLSVVINYLVTDFGWSSAIALFNSADLAVEL